MDFVFRFRDHVLSHTVYKPGGVTETSHCCLSSYHNLQVSRLYCIIVACPLTTTSRASQLHKSKAKIAELKTAIAKHFKLCDLGPTMFQLGIKIICNCKVCTLHFMQHCYCLDLLERYGFTNCSPVSTPLNSSGCLSTAQALQMPEEIVFMCTVPYVSAVGALMYLAIATRPDIAFAVGILCWFMANPGPEHWKAIKHIYRYLRGTCNFCLTSKPDPSAPYLFHAYSDADHSANIDNDCSTSAYIVKIGSGTVSWMSCLQSIVALLTTEAEFVASASASQEVIWMCQLLGELGFNVSKPSLLLLDNQSAIQVARNPGKLLLKLDNGEQLRAQLLDVDEGLEDTTRYALERLVRLLCDREQLVVRAKSHARDLLAVDARQLVPHGNGIVLNAADTGALRLREVNVDVDGSLLACRVEALSSGIVVEADADVERLLIRGEQDEGLVLVGAGLEQLEHWCGVLLSDDTAGACAQLVGRSM
jgi:hypothetical protein